MKEYYSRDSMLRSGLPIEKQMISGVIENTEIKVRAMCRVMQVYENHACDKITNIEQDYQDLTRVFAAFYEYVDGKMDVLSELSRELETGLSWVSLETLRESDDFRVKPLPREAFVSDEAYHSYCAGHGFTPVSRPNVAAGG